MRSDNWKFKKVEERRVKQRIAVIARLENSRKTIGGLEFLFNFNLTFTIFFIKIYLFIFTDKII